MLAGILAPQACETDADVSWWPEQARVSRAARAAMGETPRDATLRAFLAAVDTEAIHGAPAEALVCDAQRERVATYSAMLFDAEPEPEPEPEPSGP